MSASGRNADIASLPRASRHHRDTVRAINDNHARLAPKRPCCLEQAHTCRCGREQRAVLRQQLALDKRNRLAELGHLGFGNDGAGLGRRQRNSQ